MINIGTTKMSSKGQIVIPLDMRKGFKEDEVLSMLEDLYHAVADRYGD